MMARIMPVILGLRAGLAGFARGAAGAFGHFGLRRFGCGRNFRDSSRAAGCNCRS